MQEAEAGGSPQSQAQPGLPSQYIQGQMGIAVGTCLKKKKTFKDLMGTNLALKKPVGY